jgi:hypothetical protein
MSRSAADDKMPASTLMTSRPCTARSSGDRKRKSPSKRSGNASPGNLKRGGKPPSSDRRKLTRGTWEDPSESGPPLGGPSHCAYRMAVRITLGQLLELRINLPTAPRRPACIAKRPVSLPVAMRWLPPAFWPRLCGPGPRAAISSGVTVRRATCRLR